MTWTSTKVGYADLDMELAEIVGKQRPRVAVRNGHATAYTLPKTRKAEDAIAYAFMERHGMRWAGFDGDVRIKVRYWRALSKSNPKYWAGRADIGKPDLDNVLKLVMDALNGVAYGDDANVTCANVRKLPRPPHNAGSGMRIEIEYISETYEKG